MNDLAMRAVRLCPGGTSVPVAGIGTSAPWVTADHRRCPEWTGNPITLPRDAADLESERQAAEELTAKALSQLGGAQPSSVTVRAVIGFPAEELIDASRTADLMVVGSRGAGGFARLVIGSVSSQVVHHAHCPVVVVPSGS